jgi:predicted nucleic acid-binding protein
MEESKEKLKSVVINSNILFSSLIKEEGFTRAALLFLKENKNLRFMIPKTCLEEFKSYAGEIARKSKLTIGNVIMGFEKLTESVERMDESGLKDEIKEGLKYVKDEKDVLFVAVALKYRPSYILTYNKKDYRIKELKQLDVWVVNPKEALDLIGMELEVETKEKTKRNLLSYITKLKMLIKK